MTGVTRGESLNWFLAQGDFSYLVHGFVSRSAGQTSIVYRVQMYDPYDWDPTDTRSYEEFSAPALYGLHTAGLASHYMMYGTSSDSWFTI